MNEYALKHEEIDWGRGLPGEYLLKSRETVPPTIVEHIIVVPGVIAVHGAGQLGSITSVRGKEGKMR